MKNLFLNNMKYRIFEGVIVSLLMVTGLSGCVYQEISTPEIQIPDSVSYAVDVLPIFTTNCSLSGCHASGNIPPDLSAESAYVSLTFFGYVDVDNPGESLIYKKLTGGSMKAYAGDQEKAIILKWIEQGALDN